MKHITTFLSVLFICTFFLNIACNKCPKDEVNELGFNKFRINDTVIFYDRFNQRFDTMVYFKIEDTIAFIRIFYFSNNCIQNIFGETKKFCLKSLNDNIGNINMTFIGYPYRDKSFNNEIGLSNDSFRIKKYINSFKIEDTTYMGVFFVMYSNHILYYNYSDLLLSYIDLQTIDTFMFYKYLPCKN